MAESENRAVIEIDRLSILMIILSHFSNNIVVKRHRRLS